MVLRYAFIFLCDTTFDQKSECWKHARSHSLNFVYLLICFWRFLTESCNHMSICLAENSCIFVSLNLSAITVPLTGHVCLSSGSSSADCSPTPLRRSTSIDSLNRPSPPRSQAEDSTDSPPKSASQSQSRKGSAESPGIRRRLYKDKLGQ